MTEEQAAQLLDKADTIIHNTAEILVVNQQQTMFILMACGIILACFVCTLLFKGLK